MGRRRKGKEKVKKTRIKQVSSIKNKNKIDTKAKNQWFIAKMKWPVTPPQKKREMTEWKKEKNNDTEEIPNKTKLFILSKIQ